MSYSGNSKEQVVLNAVTNDQVLVLSDRITSEKTFLMNVINTGDTNLNNLNIINDIHEFIKIINIQTNILAIKILL